MKKANKLLYLLFVVIILSLTACGETKKVIDYGDAWAFESALNNGMNLEGKIVRFIVRELHPDSAFGYNIWAGEHLNFVSPRNPDVRPGQWVVAEVHAINSVLGSLHCNDYRF